MTAKQWARERLQAFSAGPLWWTLIGVQVLLIIGVTISELDIGITIGDDDTTDVAMAAIPPAASGDGSEGSDGSTEVAGAGSSDGSSGGDSILGAGVFAANCASCHGASGEGGIGPMLAGQSLDSAAVADVVDTGRGLMPSFASMLSAEEVAAVAAYVSGLGSGSDPTANPTTTLDDAAESAAAAGGGSVSGSRVFAANCASCHGGSGQGGVGPALAGRSLSSSAVRSVVGSGRGLMPSFASTLSAEEVAAVAAYVSSLGSGTAAGPSTTVNDSTGSTSVGDGDSTGGGSASGSRVFASNCAACHGASGQGGIGPTLAGRSLTVSSVTNVVGSGRGLMPSFSSTLSAEEVAAVAAYVSSLGSGAAVGPTTTVNDTTASTSAGGGSTGGGSASGSTVFASNCAACHGASGQGGIGPTLAGRSLSVSAVSDVVGSGRGMMPSFSSTLSAEEVAAVAAYVSGLGSGSGSGSGPGTTTGTTAPPRPSSPQETFTIFCSGCHGADGRGTANGPYILDRGDKVFRTVRRGDDPMPSFSPDVISDADLRALMDYIISLDPDNDDDDDDDRSGSNSGSG